MRAPLAGQGRRTVVASLVGAAAFAAPFAVRGQAPQRRLAFVHSGIPTAELTEAAGPFWVRRFFAALRELGYAEGRNLAVDRYSAEGRPDRFAAIVAEVVGRNPDVIVANLNDLVGAFRAATTSIPIVAILGDPVRSGMIENLGRPGGNLTGVSIDAGLEFYGRQLQVLKEAVPAATRIAFLGPQSSWDGVFGNELRAAAARLAVAVTPFTPAEASEAQIDRVFAAMAQQRIEGVLVSGAGDFLAHRALIVALARRYRLPAMYPYRDYVEIGGLMAYAPDLGELAQRLAEDVQRIFGGARAGDIPFYQPTAIRLAINQGAAQTIGLTIPVTLLARADEVIE
jgi:putative ABC transport system substrate-binding protein